MPDDLRRLLLRSNGPTLFDEATDKELQFLSIEEAVESFEDYEFAEYCPGAIPLLLDGAGNFAVYRRIEGDVAGVFAMESGNLSWQDSVRLCDDVDTLINMQERIENSLSNSE